MNHSSTNYNVERAVSLSQMIIRSNKDYDNMINYTKLCKLYYLCERETLGITGEFFTEDSMFSMKNGPVPSHTLNCIKNSAPSEYQKIWNTYMQKDGYNSVIKEPIENAAIPENIQEIIQDVVRFYGIHSWQDLIEITHEFIPEWQNPQQGSRIPISKDEILENFRF